MARSRKGRAVNGWLVVDKPSGWTSAQVVGKVKRLLNAQKVGHAGTLDPLATGILPLACGEATKTVTYAMDAAKCYRFTVRFGISTDTDDREGAVIAESTRRPGDADIDRALGGFVGDIRQRPPAFAAVKINGERAYDIARRGHEVKLEPRPVKIHKLKLLRRASADHAEFEMVCGKGAYVRAVARDLGQKLDCLAHVAALRRVAVGRFAADDAVTLDKLVKAAETNSLDSHIIPVTTALADIPACVVTEPQAHRLRCGQAIRIGYRLMTADMVDGVTVQATCHGTLVALTRFREGELDPMRVFNHKPDGLS